ncbi:MAG: SEL1-like repeat protein [Parachlamydia sp.]|jgi:TPR repeat protein|nr:SEL1-like repeat protein [Parachlamydia sp.]
MYETGDGIPQDIIQAVYWYEQALENGAPCKEKLEQLKETIKNLKN